MVPEGGDEEEDAWATYLKPENVLGDNALTVEAEISAEGEAPSIAVELGDLERELTAEMDTGEAAPVPVEAEPAAEPEIEPPTQPEQPVVPADDEPPGLSIAARLAQLRMELSAKYDPEESSPPTAPKAESKPEAEVAPPSPEAQGEEAGGETEADPVAEVEAEIETAGVAFEEVSQPETAAEAGEPPTDEPLPATEVTAEPEIEDEAAIIDESAELPPVEPEPVDLDIEPEAEAAEVTEKAATATTAPPAEPEDPEPVAEMAAETEATDDRPAPTESAEVAEGLTDEQPTGESMVEEDQPADEGQSTEEASEPPAELSSGPTDPTAAVFVDPILATFTLVDIYQVQGLYQQALQVLDILENKGGDPERIKRERATITAAMSTGSKSE
jgi:hypothetical protein